MKNGMLLALVASLSLVASASAMEMMDSGSMMPADKMMTTATMAKDSKMMMSDDIKMMAKKYVRMSTAALAKSMGYTWTKDRAMLAEKAGITQYKGTLKQNLQIRTYLMSMMKDGKMMEDASMMKN